jgi:hypothetical protein
VNANRHVAAYGVVLRLYPRSFRRDYAEPMQQLFADRVRDVGATAWLRIAPDLARTVPQQRIEAVMSNNKARLPVIIATVIVGIIAILGTGGPGIIFVAAIASTVLVFTQRELLASMFGSDRIPLRGAVTQTWWAPLAALMAVTEIAFGTVNAFSASNWGGRVFGSTILWAMGAAMLYGLTRRPFARAAGNSMILITSLPYFAMFWMIVPPLMGVVVWIGLLRDGFDTKPEPLPVTLR